MHAINPEFLGAWSVDFRKATGRRGRVRDVYGRYGRFGGLAIVVEVIKPGTLKKVFYLPYLNPAPFDLCQVERDGDSCSCEGCQFDLDETAWLESMLSATNWSEWDWGDEHEFIPTY